MAKKHGARSDLQSSHFVDPTSGEVVASFFGWVGGPKGYPTSSPLAHCDEQGKQTGGRSWTLNPKGLTIGVRFGEPAPGSFYAADPDLGWEGVKHDEFVDAAQAERKAATAERKARKKARKSIKATFRKRLFGLAHQRAETQGIPFNDALSLLAAEKREMINFLGIKLPEGAIHTFTQKPAKHHGVEGPRRPSPEDTRYHGPPTKVTGPSPDAKVSKRFAGDGMTPPRQKVLDVIANGKAYTLEPSGRTGCRLVPTTKIVRDAESPTGWSVKPGPDRVIGKTDDPVQVGECIDTADHARMSYIAASSPLNVLRPSGPIPGVDTAKYPYAFDRKR